MKKNQYFLILVLIINILPIICFAAGTFIPTDAEIAANGFGAFAGMINTIINWFISMAGVVAAVTFAIAGSKMLLNPENPGEREKALDMFKKTIIGLVIVLTAWLVIHTIVVTLVSNPSSALRFLK